MVNSRESNMILAIDPGNVESAYVLMDKQYKPIQIGKIKNGDLIDIVKNTDADYVVIEMVASYGMAVGESVFETCVWIGRFYEAARLSDCKAIDRIYRKDVKMNLCQSMRAKDSNIRQALIDRFGEVGTKKNPGWFYGFKSDIWQAYAVGTTFLDRELSQ